MMSLQVGVIALAIAGTLEHHSKWHPIFTIVLVVKRIRLTFGLGGTVI